MYIQTYINMHMYIYMRVYTYIIEIGLQIYCVHVTFMMTNGLTCFQGHLNYLQ